MRSLGFFVLFATQAVWVVFMISELTVKDVLDPSESVFRYFTNWAWTAEIIFYSVHLILVCVLQRALPYFLLYMFPALTAIPWSVFLVVKLVLYLNPNLIVDTGYNVGIVLAVDTLIHCVPVVVHALWVVFWLPSILQTIESFRYKMREWEHCMVLAVSIIGPLFLLLIWMFVTINDNVYGVPESDLPLLGAVTCLAFLGASVFVTVIVAFLLRKDLPIANKRPVFTILE